MIDASEYSIEVRKGNFDGEVCFQARVKEIPYLEEYADSFEDAYSLALESIEQTAVLMAQKKKPMPGPLVAQNDFSGRLTLRLPKTLHAYLASYAEAEDISLNSLVSNILSSFQGFESAQESQRKLWSSMGTVPYGLVPGKADRRVSRHSSLKVVGGNDYMKAAI